MRTTAFSKAALGFARLSIVDIQGGSQPFVSADRSVAAVINGEIYNHGELRQELLTAGHTFRSKSDCEVVLHGYRQWGEKVFQRLDGMFAIAIWNDQNHELLLARDRVGKKPLYWSERGEGLAFCSETSGLLCLRDIERRLDPSAVFAYLVQDSVPTPHSIWGGVQKLPPATYLCWQPGKRPRIRSFWSPTLSPRLDNASEAIDEIKQSLEDSVRERLMADVPIGLFLSSGVDSVLVGSYARTFYGQPLHSFTAALSERSYDESGPAEAIAARMGFKHHVVRIDTQGLASNVERVAQEIDEPLNDPACIIEDALAKEAANWVRVVLTGDGGDELFLGYPHAQLHQIVHSIPDWALRSLGITSGARRLLRDRGDYFSTAFKVDRLLRGISIPDLVERDLAWRGAFEIGTAYTVLSPDFRENVDLRAVFGLADSSEPPQRSDSDDLSLGQSWTWWCLRSYLLDTVLVKVDRTTMRWGVEARSPLLSARFVETALRISDQLKTGKFRNKELLRRVLTRGQYGATPRGAKHGMGVPVDRLLKGHLRPLLDEVLDPTVLKQQGVFDPATVRALQARYERGAPLRKEMWGLLSFQLWYRKFVNGGNSWI